MVKKLWILKNRYLHFLKIIENKYLYVKKKKTVENYRYHCLSRKSLNFEKNHRVRTMKVSNGKYKDV